MSSDLTDYQCLCRSDFGITSDQAIDLDLDAFGDYCSLIT